MVRAVLFDLDGTLLRLDLERFLSRYFDALRETTAAFAGDATERVMQAINGSTRAMMESHPGITNECVFSAEFERVSGMPLASVWPAYERFYAEVFPTLADGAGPADGARQVVETALELGLRVAIATNPIFPRAAVDHRLAWAGLGDLDVPVVTTYETMFACKPLPAYFTQVAADLGVSPAECIMVGDDRYLDMPAADVGMRTFYVGRQEGTTADFRGTLTDLTALLPRLSAKQDAV